MSYRADCEECSPDEKKESQQIQSKIDRSFIDHRTIFMWGAVTDSSARAVVERLLYLEMEEPNKDIRLLINSPGGVITSGMAIYDTMKMISSDVSTICMGLAASMGAVLLAAGTKGKRYVWPHAKVMIHQPLISGQIIAPAIDLKIHADQIRKTRDELNRILAESCGREIAQIEQDTDRDYYMDATESVSYGIADALLDKPFFEK